MIGGATGPDEETLRVLANLGLKRTPEAKQAMAALLKTSKRTGWADGPLARVVADTLQSALVKTTGRAFPDALPEDALGAWDDLFAGAITLLGDDLDHYSTTSALRSARGMILGRRGQILFDNKELAGAEKMFLQSHRVLEKARAAHAGVKSPDTDQMLTDAVDRLVRLYEAMKRPQEVAKWRAKHDETTGKSSAAK